MLAEARAAMPDNPQFQAEIDKVEAQHAEVMARRADMGAAPASIDADRIEAAQRARPHARQ